MISFIIFLIFNLGYVVNAHPFSICPGFTDHLHVSEVDMTPEKPQANKPFSIKVIFKPDTTYDAPIDVDVSVKVFGVKVAQAKIDACGAQASEFVTCPIKAGVEQTLQASFTVPNEVPKDIEAVVQISLYHGSQPISCFISKVNTESSKENNNEDFVGYFVNKFSDNKDSEKMNGLRVSSEPTPKVLSKHENSMRFFFQKWLDEFHKTAEIEEWYPAADDSSKETFEQRFLIFAKNFVDIILHNKKFNEGKVTYAKKMNQFGHLNSQEFRAIYLSGYRSNLKKRSFLQELSKFFGKSETKIIPSSPSFDLQNIFESEEEVLKDDSLPDTVDWVAKGAVAPVKNQGSCGSCWAFSAISALESAYFLKYGVLKTFSEQELVSCDVDCYGCRGGVVSYAFDWIVKHGGVCSDKDYPYASGSSGSNGLCRVSKCTPDPKSVPTETVEVDHTERALKEAVARQPVSVAIEADQYAFQFYSHGVLTGECGDRDDHGVVVVGYGNLNGVDYWKVRNSWGASWGMEGYVLIQRGKQVPNNDGECGILVDPLYPVL